MHSNLTVGNYVTIHRPTGETTRELVTYVGSAYFTSCGTRYRTTTGLPIWISGPYSVATPDEHKETE